MWLSARTPSSKVLLLAQAHQQCVDAIFRHYLRPTYERGRGDKLVLRPAILDRTRLIPRKREMIAIFTYCLVKSAPPNLESQSRLIFDLASRHAVASSDVAVHALGLMFMATQRILSLEGKTK